MASSRTVVVMFCECLYDQLCIEGSAPSFAVINSILKSIFLVTISTTLERSLVLLHCALCPFIRNGFCKQKPWVTKACDRVWSYWTSGRLRIDIQTVPCDVNCLFVGQDVKSGPRNGPHVELAWCGWWDLVKIEGAQAQLQNRAPNGTAGPCCHRKCRTAVQFLCPTSPAQNGHDGVFRISSDGLRV